jgi:acyl-CoA thioesterase-1
LAGLIVSPALAGVTAACRVPEPYLHFPIDLKRTERLIDLKRPIRILVLGPAIEGPEVIERRHSHLAQALSQRLPGVAFDLLDGWHGARIAEEDFDRLRGEVADTQPDLILWQVGTSDALASTDPLEFGGVLTRAAQWAKELAIDFVFIDPPYLPHVSHEPLYGKMVLAISAVSDGARINLFRRYAAMQYLERAQLKPGAQHPHCMSELLAEAIVRAVTR